ncbi:DUF5412 family protein [Sediminibacillus massiliensis]|uniref:DUF5412 family protein n=1 Tax=Sediminibacillus massiliensis TaxID=1926277 RepID=UPI0009883D5F|nr:DUF5412 family protein [Sediminibacillus massiliensis]
MAKKYNLWSFYILICCIGMAIYSLYSNIHNMWLIAPPNYILFLISVFTFIFGVKGFQDKRSPWSKLRSWLTVTFSALLSILLLTALILMLLASSMGANKHIKTVTSPENDYTLKFYRWDAGAAGSFGIRGELHGPLWFKKRFYYQETIEKVDVEWESNRVVTINNLALNLDEGETHGY